MDTDTSSAMNRAVRDGVTRAVGAVGLVGIGLIHLLDASSKFHETPYMGWMYVGLIAGALVTAFALIRGRSVTAWLAAGGLAASAMLGFTLTRTVGLPQAHGDIGNWSEPLGMASLFVEAAVLALAVSALTERDPSGRRIRPHRVGALLHRSRMPEGEWSGG